MPLSLRNVVIVFLLGLLLTDCAKWKVEPYDLVPQVKTGTSAIPATTSVQVEASVETLGPNTLKEFGIVYSASNQTPTISDVKVPATGTGGKASVMLNGLRPGTIYYYRTYATNNKDITGYGETRSFTTSDVIPEAQTLDVLATTPTSIQIQCQVANAASIALKEYGIVYSTTNNPPTTADTKVAAVGTGGKATVTLANLQPNTTYYCRAYAISSSGAVGYGETKPVKTGEPAPAVETLDVVGTPASTSAQVQCQVTNAGAISLKEYGIVYSSTNAQPTTADGVAKATGSGVTTTVSLSGLQPNTTYNYRAYATSNLGTTYATMVKQVKTDPGIVAIGAVSLTNNKPSQLGNNSATVNIKVEQPGAVAEYGVVITSNPNQVPDLKSGVAAPQIRTTPGPFPAVGTLDFEIKGLTENSPFFVVAYAKDKGGKTVYSNESVGFQTKYGVRGNWQQLANFPTERAYSYNPLFTIGGKVYVGSQSIGASSNYYYFKQLYEYDPATNFWTQKKDFPGTGRTEATVAVLNNKAYVMFGATKGAYFSDAWEYDPASDSWRQLTNPPATKANGSGVFNQQAGAIPYTWNNQVYALFGRGPQNGNVDQTTIYNSLYTLNPSGNGSWGVSFPFNEKGIAENVIYAAARSSAFSFQYDKWLYFGGGVAASSYNGIGPNLPYNTYFNSRQIWVCNVETGELSKAATLPGNFNDCSDPNATGGRMSGFAFVVGSKAYITDCTDNQMFIMDLSSSNPSIQTTTLRANIGPNRTGTTGIGIGVGNKAYFGLRNADWWEFTP